MRREQPNCLNGERKREKNYGKEYRFHWRETLYQSYTFLKNLKTLGLRWVFTAATGGFLLRWAGPLSIVVCGLLTAVVLLWTSAGSKWTGFSRCGAGLSCPVACAIFLGQRSNLCPLHLQVNSQPLYHQGSPVLYYFFLRKKFQVPQSHR